MMIHTPCFNFLAFMMIGAIRLRKPWWCLPTPPLPLFLLLLITVLTVVTVPYFPAFVSVVVSFVTSSSLSLLLSSGILNRLHFGLRFFWKNHWFLNSSSSGLLVPAQMLCSIQWTREDKQQQGNHRLHGHLAALCGLSVFRVLLSALLWKSDSHRRIRLQRSKKKASLAMNTSADTLKHIDNLQRLLKNIRNVSNAQALVSTFIQ